MPTIMWRKQKKGRKKIRKEKRVVTLEEEKIVRWVVDDKEDWGREKEVEMVPKNFLKQRKVFEKVESERMPTRKIWDHAIDLKEMFKP